MPMTRVQINSQNVEHTAHSVHLKLNSTVNVLKLQTFSLSVLKMLVIKAGTHKILGRMANREDPDQTAS